MITRQPRDRPGLTLIELLAVLSIVGLLVVVLLPAIQFGRESARRATCQDHLRQLGLALQSHATEHQALPALYNGGFQPQPRWAIDEFHFYSWRTVILPQIEQSAFYAQININVPATVASNQTAINVRISTFVCPSSNNPHQTVPDIDAWNDGAFPVAKVGTAARSDYEAIGGVQVARQTKVSSDLSIIQFGPWGEPSYDLSNLGYSLGYRLARLSDITDGLSTTILVGERAGRPDRYRKGEPVSPYGGDPRTDMENHQAAWAISTHFWWLVLGLNPAVNQDNSGIFSFHPGGPANVALADGSVRFLKDTTARAILKRLTTRSGSEVVDPE